MHRLFPVTLTGALLLGCTHDFDQFEPVSGSTATTSTTTTGSGGSATTTGSGGKGGAQGTGGQSAGGAGTGGAGTGGVGGVGGQSTGGAGGQGTGGALPDGGGVEDCTNGKDDDGDGKADCADPKCNAGFTCAPAAPAGGWTGPAWLFDGATASAPSCAGAFGSKAYEGHRDIASVPAVCGKCSCDAATGTCNLGQLTMYGDGACGQAQGTKALGQAGQCTDVQPPANTKGFKADAPSFASGSCTPNKPGLSKPAPTWGTTGVLCIGPTSTAGCGGQGATCAARPAAPFGASLCIWDGGEHACPADYPTKHTFWDGATDNRDCTACTCGDATGTCSATTSLYDKQNCQGKVGEVANDGTCQALNGGVVRMRTQVQVNATCQPGGGQPTGSVVEGPAQTTVCCAK